METRQSAVKRIFKEKGGGELGENATRLEFVELVLQAEERFAHLTRNRKTSQLYWIAKQLACKYPTIFTKPPTIGSVRNYLKELKTNSKPTP